MSYFRLVACFAVLFLGSILCAQENSADDWQIEDEPAIIKLQRTAQARQQLEKTFELFAKIEGIVKELQQKTPAIRARLNELKAHSAEIQIKSDRFVARLEEIIKKVEEHKPEICARIKAKMEELAPEIRAKIKAKMEELAPEIRAKIKAKIEEHAPEIRARLKEAEKAHGQLKLRIAQIDAAHKKHQGQAKELRQHVKIMVSQSGNIHDKVKKAIDSATTGSACCHKECASKVCDKAKEHSGEICVEIEKAIAKIESFIRKIEK